MAPTRSGDIPIEYFSGLDKTLEQVIVVCDRYSGYKRLSREIAMIILAFCWAHVRRDFLDAAKSWPVLERWMFSWVNTIGELYAHNKQRLIHWDETLALTDQSSDFEQQQQRLEEATAQMKTCCDNELKKETLHTAQRKVLESLNNHWLGLTVFIKSPQVPMDNNTAEQRMRNPGMGRKNYYGSGSQWSAHLAAMMFSIFQTLLLWKLNPFHWLHCYITACAENDGHAPKNSADFIPWLMSEERKQELVKPLPMAKVIDTHQQQIPSQPQPP
jgi:transposase